MPTTTVHYTTLPGTLGGPVAIRQGGVSRFPLLDLQGHVRQLTDSAGAVTDTFTPDAWGVEKASTGSTVNPYKPFGGWGYYRDKIERVYVRARHLRVDQGRWVSRDPIEADGLISMYAYPGNPISVFDPTGLEPNFDKSCDRSPGSKNAIRLACNCVQKLTDADAKEINTCILAQQIRWNPPQTCKLLQRGSNGSIGCLAKACGPTCLCIKCVYDGDPDCDKCFHGWPIREAHTCQQTRVVGYDPCAATTWLCLPSTQTPDCDCFHLGSP